MRILGIDPGLQRTGFGFGTALRRLHAGFAGMSLRRSR
jgi:Holliday junction resolvasome RuvABC endonuclease subunit